MCSRASGLPVGMLGYSPASATMKTKHVLVTFLAVVAACGFVLAYLDGRGIPEPKPLQLGSTFLFSALTFAWFWLDSESRSYRRSPFLSIAVIALGAFAVPYYLVRSRPSGQRHRCRPC